MVALATWVVLVAGSVLDAVRNSRTVTPGMPGLLPSPTASVSASRLPATSSNTTPAMPIGCTVAVAENSEVLPWKLTASVRMAMAEITSSVFTASLVGTVWAVKLAVVSPSSWPR